jgi:hypothetical protein
VRLSGSIRPNKRRSQRFRAAAGLHGVEQESGAVVRIRDFSSQSIAVESPVHVGPGRPIALDFPVADQTFTLRGTVVRTDRLPPDNGRVNHLIVVEVAWYTAIERLQIAGFLNAIRRSVRAA